MRGPAALQMPAQHRKGIAGDLRVGARAVEVNHHFRNETKIAIAHYAATRLLDHNGAT
jgi:hypothetical protein